MAIPPTPPHATTFPIWYILITLIFQAALFGGLIILAYVSANLISRMLKRRRMLARLLSWTILLPPFLTFGLSFYAYLVLRSESWRPSADLSELFSYALANVLVVYPANVILLAIWLFGTAFMFRKRLWPRLSRGKRENAELMNKLSVPSP